MLFLFDLCRVLLLAPCLNLRVRFHCAGNGRFFLRSCSRDSRFWWRDGDIRLARRVQLCLRIQQQGLGGFGVSLCVFPAELHQHRGEVFNQRHDFAAVLRRLECLGGNPYSQADTTGQHDADQDVHQHFGGQFGEHFSAGLRRQHLDPRYNRSHIDPHQRLVAGNQQRRVDGFFGRVVNAFDFFLGEELFQLFVVFPGMGDQVVETFYIPPQTHDCFEKTFPGRIQLLHGSPGHGRVAMRLPERQKVRTPLGGQPAAKLAYDTLI
ncbi:hypothetical protein PS689_05488 [Pseudomonas fluorescens]|nr:hypothetical protein PS689_05488 [Pseudomonas fluorescens]